MTSDRWLITAAGLALVASIVWFFWLKRSTGYRATETSGGYQEAMILVMLGFLVQWPTILTLVMFPVLAFMYVKLARAEQRDALATFGDAYRDYMTTVPAFMPRPSRLFGGAADRTSERSH